jgi:hypothetical protein
MRLHLVLRTGALAALVVLAVPAAASGQATRTWVSGVGDDANPCSRTAPCKTFAGAISKTAARGTINAMDSGGFGALTITKSITVDGHGHLASTLATGGINGITVNAQATDTVIIREIDLDGDGTTLPGLNGIRIIQAGTVRVQNVRIQRFSRSGITFEPANANAKLTVDNTWIHDVGGNGVNVAPPLLGSAIATVRRSEIEGAGGCGVAAGSLGMSPLFNFATFCGMNNGGAPAGNATVNVQTTGLADNVQKGLFANGAGATIRMSDNDVMGSVNGIQTVGGSLVSFRNNRVGGNTTNGAPTAFIDPI